MGLNDTPRADRLHIGLFGKRNSGKSSLINALTGQQLALVSDTPGTTADPVFKAMELHPIGPVVFIDTAGFDDEGDLGELRVQKTREILPQTDLALVIIDDQSALARNLDEERRWIMDFSEKDILIIEWTHGNSKNYTGVDIPVLLNSTPKETLAHRRSRNRDGAVDSPFTTLVLELEQKLLRRDAHKAQIILSKNGEILTYEEYTKLMDEEESCDENQ